MDKVEKFEIISKYLDVIKAFKNRGDVQSGEALGYRDNQDPNGNLRFENKPKTIGQGLTTTGWCVSASQALIYDKIFIYFVTEIRRATAKLISIRIKEQYYGKCYNGHNNIWHTAILVEDSNIKFIIDLTCAQFGNKFVGKDIWDFETWEKCFRNSDCEYKIFDKNGSDISTLQIEKYIINKTTFDTVKNKLEFITELTENERQLISEFLSSKINYVNNKLLTSGYSLEMLEYTSIVNLLLSKFTILQSDENTRPLYKIIEFNSLETAKAWIAKLHNNKYNLITYNIFSLTPEDACKYSNINFDELYNSELDANKFYICLELSKYYCISTGEYLDNTIGLLVPNMEIKINSINRLQFDNDIKSNTITINMECI